MRLQGATQEAVTGQVLQQLAEEGVLQHVCSCGEPFCSKHALQQHQSSCTAQNEEYDLQEILEVRGSPGERLFLCHWVGFEPDESTGDATWEPPENLSQQQMDVFWDAHPELDREAEHRPQGETRCVLCGMLCKNDFGRKQ